MLNCDTVRDLLTDYMDHTLSASQMEAVQHHLSQCSACQKVYADVQIITQRLQTVATVQTSRDFDYQLRQRLLDNQSTILGIRSSQVRSWSFGLSGAVIAAAISFFMFSQLSVPPENPAPHTSSSVTIRSQSLSPGLQTVKSGTQAKILARNNSQKDSLKNFPEKVDANKIKLVEQER